MVADPIRANAMSEIRNNPTEMARVENVGKFANVPLTMSAQTVATSELHSSTSNSTAQSNLGDHPYTSSVPIRSFLDDFKRGCRRAKELIDKAINKPWDYFKHQEQVKSKIGNAPQFTNMKQLKPGDVLIFTSDGIVRTGVKALSAYDFNHAAIYIGHGEVVEATKDGVVKHSLRDALSDQRIGYVLRQDGLNDTQRVRLANAAKGWEGAKYAYDHLIECFFGASGNGRRSPAPTSLPLFAQSLSKRFFKMRD